MDLKSVSSATLARMTDAEAKAWLSEYIAMRDKEEEAKNKKKEFDWSRFLSKKKMNTDMRGRLITEVCYDGIVCRYATDRFSAVMRYAYPSSFSLDCKDYTEDDWVRYINDKGDEIYEGDWRDSMFGKPYNILSLARAKYPNCYTLDVSKVRNALKRLDNLYETGGRDEKDKKIVGYGKIAIPYDSIGDDGGVEEKYLLFKPNIVEKMLYCLDKFGVSIVRYDNPHKGLVIIHEGWVARFMPSEYDEPSEKNKENMKEYFWWKGDEDGKI